MKLKDYSAQIEETFAVPNDPDKAKVTLRLLTPGEDDEIMGATSSMKVRPGDDPEISVDLSERGKLFVCKRITAWENFFGDNGKPLPCTDKNKLRVAATVPNFVAWVRECYDKMAEKHSRQEIELEGNSEDSQDG